jgi:hypothetical protein
MISSDDIRDMAQVVVIESDAGIRLVEFEGKGAFDRARAFVSGMIGGDFDGRIISAVRYRTTGNYDYAKRTSTGICR